MVFDLAYNFNRALGHLNRSVLNGTSSVDYISVYKYIESSLLYQIRIF
jgi:hypothetical protein